MLAHRYLLFSDRWILSSNSMMIAGSTYVGQTAWCANARLTEDKRNVRITAPGSEIARHLSDCEKCFPRWESSDMTATECDEMTRVVRVLFIEKKIKTSSAGLFSILNK